MKPGHELGAALAGRIQQVLFVKNPEGRNSRRGGQRIPAQGGATVTELE